MGLLAKNRIVATPSFNRWMIPPAALAIHLCLGMAYGFSVFWLPLSRALGITNSIPCSANMSFITSIFITTCDWKISSVTWVFTLFFIFLGGAAAMWGKWVDHVGPRKAGFISALCWCGGLVISAIGVYWHQLWLLWLGSGVIGGIGLGLGYISPVSTLIKWFPDRRGMATGMAIMGFGGGAMIGAPLADKLMNFFATPTSVGVWETFLSLAMLYFIFMMGGAFSYRIPPPDWKPANWIASATHANVMVTTQNVHLDVVLKTPQFWLLWWVLCLNVTAGIAIISMASPMLQEMFGGKLIGINLALNDLSITQQTTIAGIAAGFTGLLSLFNIAGRIIWSTFSDYIGRKATYAIFFILGFLLYAAVPTIAHVGSILLFTSVFCIALSMYGGGFATIPAYLADIFGTRMVGAIHGRLLTAWSAAGIFGPVIVNYIREYQLAQGASLDTVYDLTLYILASLLLVGGFCNLMVRAVHPKYHINEHREAEQQHIQKKLEKESLREINVAQLEISNTSSLKLFLAWSIVGIPLLWGLWVTLNKVSALFF